MRRLGHRAFSCDIQPCSGGHPEWHIQADVLPLLNGDCEFTTADTHTHTARTVGYDYSSSALYISDKRCDEALLTPMRSGGKGCCEVAGEGKGGDILYVLCFSKLRQNSH